MATTIDCPIWGEGYEATATGVWTTNKIGEQQVASIEGTVHSARAGGAYRISVEAQMALRGSHMTERQKAWLTTWLIDQRRQGITEPTVLRETVLSVLNSSTDRSLSMHQRAERLLRYAVAKTDIAGAYVVISNSSHEAFASAESIVWEELTFLLEHLKNKGLLTLKRAVGGDYYAVVTVDGYADMEKLATNPDSTQAFVAMWFADEMEEAYNTGIKPAIESVGYQAMRIDLKPDVNKIDDEILAEIRRSQFLVADMTHGEEGARGGVYFEAGFAFGLNLPVIFTCRSDKIDALHFDTRQYYHIVWANPKELREGLTNRIGAVIGDGPLRKERDNAVGVQSNAPRR